VAGLKRRMAHDEALRKADHTRLLQVRCPLCFDGPAAELSARPSSQRAQAHHMLAMR